jgi:DNA polymerase-3 subunit delta'
MKSQSPIIGHMRQREQLLKDVEKSNTAHAYLFAGKRHLGKFTTAHWFAAELLTQREEEKDATLHLLEKNMHPDCLVLDQLWMEGTCTDWNVIARTSNVPQEHRKKAKVKSNVIGIDDIRVLQTRLHETSQRGRICCLIRSIERLHITAANALLKILEEPPKDVVFCFTTESLSSLPETIVSRMRVLHFSPVPRKELAGMLEDLPVEDQALLLGIAQGAPGIIQRSLEDPEVLRLYRQIHIDAKRFLSMPSLLDRFQKLNECVEEKQQSPLFLQHLFLHLQQDLRRGSKEEAERAAEMSRKLFLLLHTLNSNTHKSLLAARTAFHCST